MSNEDIQPRLNRRQLLGSTAAVAAAGAAAAGGALTFAGGGVTPAMAGTEVGLTYEGKPGALDEYCAFFSSGQTGGIRIVGLPAMREFMRIPLFTLCSATGWRETNESLKIMTENLR